MQAALGSKLNGAVCRQASMSGAAPGAEFVFPKKRYPRFNLRGMMPLISVLGAIVVREGVKTGDGTETCMPASGGTDHHNTLLLPVCDTERSHNTFHMALWLRKRVCSLRKSLV